MPKGEKAKQKKPGKGGNMKKKTKRGKYPDWITEEGTLKIEGWARDGLTDEQIADKIGIAASTLYVWKLKYTEIAEALKKGKEVIDRQVENALLKRGLGFQYTEEKIIQEEIDGVIKRKKEIITRYALPDTAALIFWLKNRKPEEWRNNPEIGQGGNTVINFIPLKKGSKD